MKEFVCTECANGPPFNYCYYQNRSSAFPAYILDSLGCPMGHNDSHNWRYVEGLLVKHIPHEGHGEKVITLLSQKDRKLGKMNREEDTK